MRMWAKLSKVGWLVVLGLVLGGANFAQADLSYDMGSSSSALQSGFTRVTESTLYTSLNGYGWDTALNFASHGAPASSLQNLLLDYDYGSPGSTGQRTFKVDLAAGEYAVTLYFYDQTNGKTNIEVYQGSSSTLLAEVDTLAPNTLITKEFNVTMASDGTLDLRFFRPADVDPPVLPYTDKWVINGIVISAVPLPSTMLLLGSGLFGLGLLRFRKRA
ncbi:MAG: PEP-CTERM sorting domain-containing protein [Syntrophobacterales bacterium]|nr:PEP-CTERM sorting domain-containing protein [Syntrophobacterales bacterium]